jgi:hypothetical protein
MESITELYARYTRASNEATAADKEIEERVLGQLKELIKQNDMAAAKSLVSGMPDCVSKVFACDMLRQVCPHE